MTADTLFLYNVLEILHLRRGESHRAPFHEFGI